MPRCQFLERLEEQKLRLDARTYTTLMQGWIESKNMERAMDLFKQMKKKSSASYDRDIHLTDRWLGSIDGTNGHG